MSTFVDLDSVYRDRTDPLQNENNYIITPSQIETWRRAPRTVTTFPRNPNTQNSSSIQTVELLHLTMPYDSEVSPSPLEYSKLYVQFTNSETQTIRLINGIDGVHAESTFVCVYDKIQYNEAGDPIWIHYKCTMDQVMPIDLSKPIKVVITSRSQDIVPSVDTGSVPDPAKQTQMTLRITPYLRDGDYSNHLTTSVAI